MSKERPILFSGPMVRAILEGRKTQTRRVAKLDTDGLPKWGCPYGQPGDRLWVRESWKPVDLPAGGVPRLGIVWSGKGITWRAMNPDQTGPWKPSIHMPRIACRITLEVTGVRVERLQDISGFDAIAEGCHGEGIEVQSLTHQWSNRISQYHTLWESINGLGSWESDPWVWVIEFKKITP